MCRSSSIPCRLGVQQLTTMAINRPLSGYGTRNIVPQSVVCDTKQMASGRSPSATTRYLSYSGVERITSFSLTGLHVSSARCNSHFLGLCSSMFTPFNCTRAQACTPTHSFFFFFLVTGIADAVKIHSSAVFSRSCVTFGCGLLRINRKRRENRQEVCGWEVLLLYSEPTGSAKLESNDRTWFYVVLITRVYANKCRAAWFTCLSVLRRRFAPGWLRSAHDLDVLSAVQDKA